MQLSFRAPEGSNIFDLVLNTYTSLDMLPKFIKDNNITNLNMISKVGDIFIYETDLIINKIMIDRISRDRLLFTTSDINNTTFIGNSNYLLIESYDNLLSESNIKFLI